MSEKVLFKPGNMLYPLPAVMISSADKEGHTNIMTASWAGTICSDPAMISVSIRKERYSYHMIRETGEFVINLTTEKLVRAADYCGVRSGRDGDKWKAAQLTPMKADTVRAPLIAESPVNIECRVEEVIELGTHDMFIASVTAVHGSKELMDDKNVFHLNDAGLIVYSHGTYFSLGREIGTFGFSVNKKKT